MSHVAVDRFVKVVKDRRRRPGSRLGSNRKKSRSMERAIPRWQTR